MAKTTFTAEQLEAAIEGLVNLNDKFPELPIDVSVSRYSLWEEGTYPIVFKQIGEDKNVAVYVEEHFGGEEGGDHGMYTVLRVGYGEDKRCFMKTGEYNSWDSSEWDGSFDEVVPEEVKVIQWSVKK